ncbi:hypothetical protein CPB86DRAFT_553542 [Serendipita vermifera]|nr:hypothetical protein CPB86DRAFT_553542 [Serendipita vermifera]
MALSAVERTPVEIWRLILGYAVTTPFHPFTEMGVLSTHLSDNFNIYSEMCPIHLMYQDAEATMGRLRLVCRIFADFLRGYTSNLLTRDPGTCYYMPERANNAIGKGFLFPSAFYRRNIHYLQWRSYTYIEDNGPIGWTVGKLDEQLLDSCIPNVGILILGPLITLCLNFLIPLSNLVVLSFQVSSAPVSWSMTELSTCAPWLSHLYVKELSAGSKLFANQLIHPNLRYLSLEIVLRGTRPHLKRINWAFPSLQTFVVHGTVSGLSHITIDSFIARHGKGLIGLDIGYHLDNRVPATLAPLTRILWNNCPNLKAFGMDVFNFFTNQNFGLLRETREGPAMELLLHGLDRHLFRPLRVTNILQRLRSRWNVTKVIYPSPWNQLSKTQLGYVTKFCGDIPVVDRFSISVQDELERRSH